METIEKYVTPLTSIPIVGVDVSVSTVIAKTEGSHFPVFVYKGREFAGIIWPYHLIFNNPPNKSMKAGHVVVRPAQITKDTPLEVVCEYMLGMRVYILPVFTANSAEPVGLISALTILEELKKNKKMLEQIAGLVSYRTPLVTNESSSIKDVYTRMRKENQSRAVIVDKQGVLSGLISRRDIYLALVEPISGKQKYKSSGGDKQMVFDTDWIERQDYHVGQYATNNVLYDRENGSLSGYIGKMLAGKSGSIIIVDGNRHPKSVLSTRSFLQAIAQLKPQKSVNVVFTDKNRVVDAFRKMELDQIVDKFTQKTTNIFPLTRVELLIDTVKNSSRRVSKYLISFHVILASGTVRVAKTVDKNLRTAVQMAVAKIENQLKKRK